MKQKLVAAGYMPLDIVVRDGRVIAHQAGGTASNVASMVAYLGWQSVLAGQLGDDLAADAILSDLENAGVSTDQLHQTGAFQTPRLVYRVNASSHNFGYSCPRCGTRFSRSRPLTIGQALRCVAEHPRAEVFFFDRANPGTLTLARHYASSGSLVVFEPAAVQDSTMFREAVSLAHVVKLSGEHLELPGDLAKLRPRRDQFQVVTLGAEGLKVMRENEVVIREEAFAARSVDSGGCGDWTTAGLVVGLQGTPRFDIDGMSVALRRAQALAALNSTLYGARAMLSLTRSDVVAAVERTVKTGRVSPLPVTGSLPVRLVDDPYTCDTCLSPVGEMQSRVPFETVFDTPALT